MNLYDIAIARKLSGGGGGSSDFSTAEVTITLSGSQPMIMLPHTTEMGAFEGSFGLVQNNGTYSVILYKGLALGLPNNPSIQPTLSGDITVVDGMLLITGNGTITY